MSRRRRRGGHILNYTSMTKLLHLSWSHRALGKSSVRDNERRWKRCRRLRGFEEIRRTAIEVSTVKWKILPPDPKVQSLCRCTPVDFLDSCTLLEYLFSRRLLTLTSNVCLHFSFVLWKNLLAFCSWKTESPLLNALPLFWSSCCHLKWSFLNCAAV